MVKKGGWRLLGLGVTKWYQSSVIVQVMQYSGPFISPSNENLPNPTWSRNEISLLYMLQKYMIHRKNKRKIGNPVRVKSWENKQERNFKNRCGSLKIIFTVLKEKAYFSEHTFVVRYRKLQ